jgi:photosynthetic reaction center cytochrome c subunit
MKKYGLGLWIVAALFLGLGAFMMLTSGWERPPIDTVQKGYRGLGMEDVINPRTRAMVAAMNRLPEVLPPAEPGGQKASEVYQNVQVLGDLTEEQFLRLMTAITEWVSPEQGCNYCHVEENLADDSPYTKRVSRRMLQMVAHTNDNWQKHVVATGVTCYTCHRGQPVPAAVWSTNPGPVAAMGPVGYRAGMNIASPEVAFASLPYDPFTPYLLQSNEIRVIQATTLPIAGKEGATLQRTELTYGLMMHFSQGLGVNCTFCHNSRSFFDWDQSTPQRTTAWYGIRMTRDLNNNFMVPLTGEFPPHRLGPLGDVLKVNCTTCHEGVNKPLLGAPMLSDYPELKAVKY